MTQILFTVILATTLAIQVAIAQEDPSREVNDRFVRYTEANEPGCIIGVYYQGKIRHLEGYGVKSVDTLEPLAACTPMYIASTANQFTAAAVMSLIDDGQIGKHDDVRKYFPELPDYGHTITVSHLLYHRSGLRDFYELGWLAGWTYEALPDMDGVIAMIAAQKELNFEPGKEALYSNTGYLLLAQIVEKAARKPFRDVIEKRFFKVLKLKDSEVCDDPGLVPQDAADGHLKTGHEKTGHEKIGGELRAQRARFSIVGPGGIYMTAEDLLTWGIGLNKGRIPTLDKLRMREVLELEHDQRPSHEFGRVAPGSMLRDHRGLAALSSGGSFAGFRAELLRFPDDDLVVTCLSNNPSIDSERVARDVADAFLQYRELETNKVRTAPRAQNGVPDCRQVFRDPETKRIIGFEVRNGLARLDILGSPMTLEPLDAANFCSVGTHLPVTVSLPKYGSSQKPWLSIVIDGKQPFLLRQTLPIERVGVQAIKDIAGRYESKEIGIELTFVERGGKLGLATRLAFMPLRDFQALNRDLYLSPSKVMIEVIRGDGDEVEALRVSTPLAWRILFTPN